MASQLLRAARCQLSGNAGEALLSWNRGSMVLVRRMTESGRVLSEEEKAAENIYFKKLEHEQLEKLHAKLDEHQKHAESAHAKADEAIAAAKAAKEAAEAGGAAGSSASGALYALGGVAVGILGMYLLGPKSH